MIKMDPELKKYMNRLNNEERAMLEEQLKRDGCLDPLKVWIRDDDEIVLDGHNRYEICTANNIPFKTTPINGINDILDAEIWIDEFQMGRRNLTDSERALRIGRLYEKKKQRDSNPKGINQYNKGDNEDKPQNDAQPIHTNKEESNTWEKPKRTSDELAKELGISKATVERNAQYAKAIDKIEEIDEGIAQKIVSEEVKIPKQAIIDFGKQEEDVQVEIVEELAKGEVKTIEDAVAKVEQRKESKSKSKFNLTNDNIEWSKWTWNPVTGCKHGCKYCYARDIAIRFNPEGFEPTFHENRLDAPMNTKIPKELEGIPGANNVFVCSMADLFGEWVPDEWITAVLDVVKDSPEWNFLFLTKNPKRLTTIEWPMNAWVGTTVDCQARVNAAKDAFKDIDATVKFVSCEPLQEELTFGKMDMFDWVIVGGRSKSSGMPAGQPEWSWVEKILNDARSTGAKVYFKPNLNVRPMEYPNT